MNSIVDGISLLSATATGSLCSAIWEGAVLALCVSLCLHFLPRLSAAARSTVWLNLFVLLALLHFLPAITEGHHTAAAPHASWVQLNLGWSLGVAGLWISLSLWRGAQLVASGIQLHRMAKRATPIPVGAELQELLDQAAAPRRAEVCVSDEVARPSVLGFFRPRILLPPLIVEKLSCRELRQVVLHEMEHLRRADDWTNLLQKVSLVIFPLNPVLYWVEHRLCTERELACDDRVLNSGPGRKAYAICLTHLAEYSILRRSLNLALGAWEKRPELVHRIQRILAQPMLSMGRKPAMVATGSLIVGTLGCALVLAHSPQVVSFVPSEISAHIAQSTVAPHLTEMSRQLGGTPQLVKAVMPQKATTPGIPISKARVRSATLHAHRRERPVQMRQQLFVLTEWTDMGSQSRLFMTVARNQAAQPVVIPASYAVVQTPNGWLILQI